MRRFDYLFLKNGDVPASVFSRAIGISKLRERTDIRRMQNPSVFYELESNAKYLSVKESNAIEGIATSENRLSSLMDRSVEPVGHDETEISGYRDALELIHANYSEMELNEETIRNLHRMISYRDGGEYKKHDNVIMEIDGHGNKHVHFIPTPAKETPEAMEQLVLSYIHGRQEGVEPLLLIPCFILDFLSIHPFPDGNGRVSRLLTLLLLYQDGYDAGKYMSLEERISYTKDRYYDALSKSSQGWSEGRNDYFPFIAYYLDTLSSCYIGLDRCFATISGKKATKKNRIEAAVMNSLIPISKREIMSMLPDVSEDTVEVCLHRMMVDGRIEKIGGNRNARYRPAQHDRKHQEQ